MTDAAAVLDLGKTNLKLIVVDAAGRILDTVMADNTPVAGPPYRHVDEAHVWDWLLGALASAAARHAIKAIVPCTYGSTAALVGADGLVLPIMDYEDDPPADIKAAYAEVAPPFAEVYAPTNPGGLTLGRQLFWQSRAFAGAFARARHILPHAQYWAWRLSGVAAVEVTSLGAQTHLWNPRARAFSSLVAGQGWKRLFPPLRRAWDVLGPVTPAVAAATGLPADTPVLCGIHDSNANYLRYLAAGMTDFTLMSTGTWVISFNAAHPLDALHQDRDTVSNTDVHGNPVACSRFMGGREFDILAGDAPRDAATLDDVAGLIADGTMALPSFTDSGGPFPGTGGRGRIVGPQPETPEAKAALATLYTALMCSQAIDLIGSRNDIVIDGSFARNRLFCRLIADVRLGQTVRVSTVGDGTALGAARLWRWQDRDSRSAVAMTRVASPALGGLPDYEEVWKEYAAGHVGELSEWVGVHDRATSEIPDLIDSSALDASISSISQSRDIEVHADDPIAPSDIRHEVQEVHDAETLRERYECIIYEFERDGAYCMARADDIGTREVAIFGPYSGRDQQTMVKAPEFRAAVMSYLKRRYDVILELRNSGYARIWRRSPQ